MPDTFPSLVAGYTVFWLIMVAYLRSLRGRIKKLEQEVYNQGD